MREPLLQPGDDPDRISAERRLIAQRFAFEPEMVELDAFHIEAVEAERVDVAMTDVRPVDELNAELVGGIGRADEIALVDVHQFVEQHDLWDRRFADADGADLLGFDQLDLEVGDFAHDLGERGSGHPSGRAAADDHDLADSVWPQKTNSGSSGAAGL